MASRHAPPPPPPVLQGNRPRRKTSIWKLLSSAAFGCVVIALPILQANEDVNWGVYQLMGQVIYRSPMPKPMWGGVYSKQVEIDTFEGSPPMRIGEVSVEYSPWWQLAEVYTPNIAEKMGAKQVYISFDRIDNPSGYPFAEGQGELAVGGISMVPGEAEGCGDIAHFGETEMREMGLTPSLTRLTTKINVEDNRVTMLQTYDSPGIATTTITKIGVGDNVDKDMLQSIDLPEQIVWKQHQWNVEDKGFIKARNSYCAAKMGVSEAQFLGYHIAAIERHLAAEGMAATLGMRQQYIEFAANGGVLNIEGSYSNEVTEANFYDLSWNQQFSGYTGYMKRDNSQTVFAFSSAPVVPIADEDAGKTTYQILQKEGAQPPTVYSDAIIADLGDQIETTGLETAVVKANVDPEMTSRVVIVPLEENESLTNFNQLGSYIGRRARIERRGKDPVIGKILAMTPRGAKVRINKEGGYIEMELLSVDFVRAQVFPLR